MSLSSSNKIEAVSRKRIQGVAPELDTDNMSGMHILMVLLYFSSMFLIIHYFQKTFISLNELFKFLSLLMVITFLIPIGVYRWKYTMSYYEYILWNCLSLAPFICALALLLNFHITSNEYEESFKIENISKQNKKLLLTLNSSVYSDYQFVREYSENDFHELYRSDSLMLTFAEGIFGRKVLKDRRLK